MSVLREFRELAGPAPRTLQVELPEQPEWAKNDLLDRVWKRAPQALATGEPAIGLMCWANDKLFTYKWVPCAPGSVLYSFDPCFGDNPSRLELIRVRISMYREPDPEVSPRPHMRHMHDLVAGDYERVFHYRLPPELSGGSPIYMSTPMFFPEMLPQGYLCHQFVPLLVERDPEGICLVAPKELWPGRLRDKSL